MNHTREATVDIGGKKYVITSDDDYLEGVKDGFEPAMVKLFKALANGCQVVIDIGANIGCTAIYFGELSNRVYAFEPSPSTFALLEKNIANSGLKNVTLQNIALGAEPGESTLTFAPSNRSGGFVSDRTQTSPGHLVERIVVRTLDEVIEALNPSTVDFIKMDVEGFEGHVLRGAEKTLSTYHPSVVLELNHWCLNVFQRTSVPDFFDFLRSRFPILLAVDGSDYLNLHDPSESYMVMYHHVLQGRFPNILAAFERDRLRAFNLAYHHGFTA